MEKYEYRGESKTLPAWAKELKVAESTLRSRLVKLGMTVDEAFAKPADKRFNPTKKAKHIKPIKPPPELRRHPSGRAWCRWSEYGSRKVRGFGAWPVNMERPPESTFAAYRRFCAEWYANAGRAASPQGVGQRGDSPVVSVAVVVMRYVEHAAGYYRKNGKATSEIHGVRAALAPVNATYGDTAAADFGPAQFRTVRDQFVRRGLSLKTVNDYAGRIARAFGWAAGQGMVPAAIPAALREIEALEPGRSDAPIGKPVESADDDDVAKILPHLHVDPKRAAVLAAMVKLQRLTGMRPGDVCELRAVDIDRSRDTWRYAPASGGKMLHLEKRRRVIWFGPAAREILKPLLEAAESFPLAHKSPPQAVDPTIHPPLFRIAARRGSRILAISTTYYRLRIAAACRAAGVPVFRPNQLRHAKATEVQRRYEDDEAVAAVLGNSPEVARQVYVDAPADAVARRIAEAMG